MREFGRSEKVVASSKVMPSVPFTAVCNTSPLNMASLTFSAFVAELRVTDAPPCNVATLPIGLADVGAGCPTAGAGA